jgi:hypothetical protein
MTNISYKTALETACCFYFYTAFADRMILLIHSRAYSHTGKAAYTFIHALGF